MLGSVYCDASSVNERHTTIFAVDRSGRRREILRRERQRFDSDGEGQGIQTPSLAPRAPPSRLEKRNFLSC